jgi:Protein of unknown function (DUF1045)
MKIIQLYSWVAIREKLLTKAKKITLIATGLNLIWEKHILDLLIERAKSGDAIVTICLGNPFSPHVEDRLIEEEMQGNRPVLGREGVLRNIRSLVERLDGAGNPPNFSLVLFESYPTFATLIFDQDLFIYPYAYQVLGNTSPIFHFQDNGNEESKFFVTNAERIIRDSISAKDVISRKINPKFFSDNWIAAAIYIIPNENTPLYQFGATILGYDVWKQQVLEADKESFSSKIRPYVGEASQYGFHATMADALFFATDAEIDRVEAELRMLANDFSPFILSKIRIEDRQNEGNIVMLCDDESGSAEALHFELISRIYRIAISSFYLADKTQNKVSSKSPLRSNLMIERYGAPYILKEFNPHFSLCAPAPDDLAIRQEILKQLQESFAESNISTNVEVNEICLMTKKKGNEHWSISARFPLAKR